MTQRLSIISPRLIHCLTLLADTQEYLTVAELAVQCKTSKRTLFRELKDINYLLQTYKLTISSKTGQGIKMEGTGDEKLHFKSLLLQISAGNGLVVKEDRQSYLLAELLKNKSLEKLAMYSHQFQVSEATISNDVNAIEPILRNYNLHLNRKPGSNLICDGKEEDFRRAITDFVFKHIEEDKFSRIFNLSQDPWDVEDYFKSQEPDGILRLLNKDLLWRVITVLKDNDTVWIYRLAQGSYIGLILHLTIALERMMNQDRIQMNPLLLQQMKKDPLFDQAKNLSEYFEDEFEIEFPTEEVAYIAMHLKGARLLHIEDALRSPESETVVSQYELTNIVYQLIDCFEEIANVHVKQDDVLISGLITHLRPALTRIKYNMEIRNPLLKQIQTQYTQVYEDSAAAVNKMAAKYQITVVADEVGFIALHFGAALERMNQSKPHRTVKVVVVCASGIGISSLLASRIKRIFKDDILIEARSQMEVKELDEKNCDLLISTMKLSPVTLPLIVVNPLLSDEDIEKVKNMIIELSKTDKNYSKESLNLNYTQQLYELSVLSSSVATLIDEVDIVGVEQDLDMDKILNIVGYRIGKNHQSGKLIVNDLKEREKMGSILMLTEKFAMFHAKTGGVESPVFMIFRSETDEFKSPKLKGVRSIVVLLVPLIQSHGLNPIMSRLSSALLEDDAYLNAVHNEDKVHLRSHVERVIHPVLSEWIEKLSG